MSARRAWLMNDAQDPGFPHRLFLKAFTSPALRLLPS